LQAELRRAVSAADLPADRFVETRASGPAHWSVTMSDIKRTVRDTEADVKETWRRADGESVGDKVKNAGDRLRNAVEDAGDEVHEHVDEASRKASYQKGRIDQAGRDAARDPDRS
jgi:vacuolar-type H+-ATPase subunit H